MDPLCLMKRFLTFHCRHCATMKLLVIIIGPNNKTVTDDRMKSIAGLFMKIKLNVFVVIALAFQSLDFPIV